MTGIHGNIAEILDEYSLVINKGEADGVTTGMEFVVYLEGERIYDPKTKEELGKLEIVKARLKVTHVQEKFCIARTFETESSPYMRNVASYLAALNVETRIKPLNVEGLKDRSEPDMAIHVGDKARSL